MPSDRNSNSPLFDVGVAVPLTACEKEGGD